MVGDYISTSFIGGKAYGAIAVAQAPSGGRPRLTQIPDPQPVAAAHGQGNRNCSDNPSLSTPAAVLRFGARRRRPAA